MRLATLLLLAPMALAAQDRFQVGLGVEFQHLPTQQGTVELGVSAIESAEISTFKSFTPVFTLHLAYSPWILDTVDLGFTLSILPARTIDQHWNGYVASGGSSYPGRFPGSLTESYVGLGFQASTRGTIAITTGLEFRNEHLSYESAAYRLSGDATQLRPWLHVGAEHTFESLALHNAKPFLALQAGFGLGTHDLQGSHVYDSFDARGFAPDTSIEFQAGVAF